MRSTSLLTALAAVFVGTSLAAGQSLLDEVEKTLDRSAPPRATAPADAGTAAGDDAAAPAEEPRSGYLGVGLEELASGGVMVTEIAPGSPAEAAGLEVNDKITAVNRADVKDIGELGALMEAVPPGGKLTLGIVRGGKSLTITATLSDRPKETAPADGGPGEASSEPRIDLGAPAPAATDDLPPPAESPEGSELPRPGSASGRASLGVTVVTFDSEARSTSDVPVRSGALITQIRPLSPADRAGLPIGGVIVRYEGQRIETADELVAAIAASRPGDEVELSYYQGTRLASKNVTLSAAADSRLTAPGAPLRDRPLLNRLERDLEGPTRPGAASDDPSGAAPGGSEMELREEIEKLKSTVEALEMRLAEIEAKLAAARPLPDADAAPAIAPPSGTGPATNEPPADDSAPTLRPPTRRPPTNVPKLKIGDD